MNLQPALDQRERVERFQRNHRLGLVTMVFMDIVDSTDLKKRRGDHEALLLIERHHDLIRELLHGLKESQKVRPSSSGISRS